MISVNQVSLIRSSLGSKTGVSGNFLYGLYETGGSVIRTRALGLGTVESFIVASEAGVLFDPEIDPTIDSPIRVKAFSGGTSGTNSLQSAGTPSGTVTAPSFTGNLLSGHAHNFQAAVKTQTVKTTRIYMTAATVVGAFQIGEVITGGTSGNTATTASVDTLLGTARYLIVTGATGNFTNGETITGGTSGATGILLRGLIANWDITPFLLSNSIIDGCTTNNNALLVQFPSGAVPVTGTFRKTGQTLFPAVETFNADGFTSVTLSGTQQDVTSVSGGTPSGTNSIPVFSGSLMSTHTHIFSGGSTGATEIPNGTDLSILGPIDFQAIGL